ncbi:MAG TPA: nucleotide disphospho-sugar-binding domain-containing protein [Nocardioides sp.]|nr:nucleotide disphospho-sugar-binding domain-containing protein [Nocardioides sp.]
MHYLCAIWDGGGAVPPQLGAIRGLVRRGHTATVLADPTLEAEVRAVGAEFRSWSRAPHRRSASDLVADDRGISNPSRLVRLLLDELVAGPAAAFAADVLEADHDQRCDAVVAEMPLLGALAAGRSLGRPTVALMTLCYAAPHPHMPPFGSGWGPGRGPFGRTRNRLGAALAHRLWDRGVPALDQARAGLGLGPVGSHLWDQLDELDRVLVLTAREFDLPCESLPPNVRYVGPQLDDPGWADRPVALPEGEEPLVVVSLSSTPMDQIDLFRRVLRGLLGLQVRVVVTTGPAVDPADVVAGLDLSPAVSVVPSAPHAQLLPHASAVVTHGGHGTVMKALAANCPVVCMPLGRDQPDNAARLVTAGAGIRLRPSARPATIARAVRSVLDDPAYAAAAARLGAAVRAGAASGRVLDELESVARRAPYPREAQEGGAR